MQNWRDRGLAVLVVETADRLIQYPRIARTGGERQNKKCVIGLDRNGAAQEMHSNAPTRHHLANQEQEGSDNGDLSDDGGDDSFLLLNAKIYELISGFIEPIRRNMRYMFENMQVDLGSAEKVAGSSEIGSEELEGFRDRMGAFLRESVEENDRDYLISEQEIRSFVIR